MAGREMISIVIVSYNTQELLRQCLASVRRHCPEAQVIVVDNASRDGSAAMVKDAFPECRLVEMPKNVGFAPGNNAGLAQATGDYVVLLNSDTVLEDDALQRCVSWMDARPHLGATSPKLMGSDGRPQECFYPMPSVRQAAREALGLGAGPRQGAAWLAGTCLVLRASALADVGGQLDGGCFMYWEDADISARLLRKGWGVEACPDAQILHHGGASGGGADTRRRDDLHAWFVYGKHRWFTRHRPFWEAAAVWLLDLADVARCLVRAAVREDRRAEWGHARALATTLARRLVGGTPPLPGVGKRK